MHPLAFLTDLWGNGPLPGVIQLWAAGQRRTLYLRALADLPDRPWSSMTDIYTSVTTAPRPLGPHTRARAADAAGTCGMWLDIDIEDGKAANLNQAMQLAMAIAEPTLVIGSGGGIHCWYLLETPVAITTSTLRGHVATLADAWNAAHNELAQQDGWRLDRTHDLARLLRVPGTLNGKRQPYRPVVALTTNGPRYTLSQLAQLVDPQFRTARVRRESRQATIRGGRAATFRLDHDPAIPGAKFAALSQWFPDFASTWLRKRRVSDNSQSAWDASLATLAAQAGDWTDQEIVDLLRVHRAQINPQDPKLGRVDYYERTLSLARTTAQRNLRQQEHDDRLSQIRGLIA